MRNIFKHVLLPCALLLAFNAFSQSVTINGNVRNGNTKEAAGAVSVVVKGGTLGTFTDDKGNFRLTVRSFPVTLLISSIGYETKEITIQ